MDNVTAIDTRVSPTVSREAALANFPLGARQNPTAIMLADTADRVRAHLIALENTADKIAGDDTLTDAAKTLALVKHAAQVRAAIADSIKRADAGISDALGQLQAGFETEIASQDPGHNFGPSLALELGLKAAERLGGGFDGLRKLIDQASAERDGVTVAALYRAPAWALGVDANARDVLRSTIENRWSKPHVTAREAFRKAGNYLARVADIAIGQATPTDADQATASRAESNRAARVVATGEGGAA